jgi:hypothetical protein
LDEIKSKIDLIIAFEIGLRLEDADLDELDSVFGGSNRKKVERRVERK